MTNTNQTLPPHGPHGPTRSTVADERDFASLVSTSLAATRKSAEAWRTGASALITLVTAGLFIKGPSDAAKLSFAGRSLLTFFLGLGLACALFGLWQILKAAAGTPALQTFPELVETYGSVKGAEVGAANKAANQLKVGRNGIALSLALFLFGIVSWWWVAPGPETGLRIIVTVDDIKICGELQSADEQTIVVRVAGHKDPKVISFANVDNLAIVGTCG